MTGRLADIGLLVLRLGVGLSYVFLHGWNKMFGGPEAWARTGRAMGQLGLDFGHTFWGFMAAFSEFVGGLLVALGLFFRPACALIAFTMFVAVTRHLGSGDGWRGSAHALKMLFVFAGLTGIGPGRYSIDHLLSRRKRAEVS